MPKADSTSGRKGLKEIQPKLQADVDRLVAIVDELELSHGALEKSLSHAIGVVANFKADNAMDYVAALIGGVRKDKVTPTGLRLCGGCLDDVHHALTDLLHGVELLQAEYDKAPKKG